MRTPAQIEASRINGAKSRGPKTPNGKANSSRNATRHGLLSKTLLFTGDPRERERFHQHMQTFHADFIPRCPLELALVEQMALCRWRQLSIREVETANLRTILLKLRENDRETRNRRRSAAPLKTPSVIGLADVLVSNRTLEVCLRQDGAFDRRYDKALDRLMRLKAEKASRAKRIIAQTNLATN